MRPQKVSFAVDRVSSVELMQASFADSAVTEVNSKWPARSDTPTSNVAVHASSTDFQRLTNDRPEKRDLKI
jgi:hypothetical protein